jgi:hypothetical protein
MAIFKKTNLIQNDTTVFLTTNPNKQASDNVYKLWTSVGLEKLGER